MIIRKATLSDLAGIVNVHLLAFPHFFLTSLGRDFLVQYYKIYIKYSHIAYVAEENSAIEGFVVGSNNSASFYKDLKKEVRHFIFPILANMINIQLFKKILRRVIAVFFKKKVNASLKSYDNLNELTSIGVMPNDQSRGLGSQLLEKYEQYCNCIGIEGITLTTDAENNKNVLKFYEKSGYLIDQTFVQDETRTMYSLVKYFKN
jgi:ribosomal protein S18 acetylase RimI-like enzyme